MALNFEEILVDEIKINKRFRLENKDIGELAESIKKYGLLNPIIIGKDKTLIAGYRRLQAVKLLGNKTIEARIVDITDEIHAAEVEMEENIQRRQFTEEEILLAMNKLNKLKTPGFFTGVWNKISSAFGFGKK